MKKQWMFLREKVVTLYIYFIVGIFPFWIHDGFFDISQVKSEVFVAATLCMAMPCIFFSAMAMDWHWCINMRSLCIYGVMAYLALSNLQSAYSESAWWGTQGRYQGSLVYLAYCLAGLCILNFGRYEKNYVTVFLAAGTLVNLLCLLNFYNVDPLGTMENVIAWQRHIYTSTIGNVDIFAAYLSVYFPIAAVRAVKETSLKKRVLWYVCCFFAFWAMSATGCNSVYLTLGIAGICLPYFCIGKDGQIYRCIILYILFIISQLVCQALDYRLWYPLLYVDGMASHFRSPVLMGGAFLMAILLIMGYDRLHNVLMTINISKLKISWVACMAVLVIFFIVIYATHTTFDESWENHRGFIWAQGTEFFLRQPLQVKLLGIGMDCIKPAFHAFFGAEQTVIADMFYYDNLHNEYFQYMVTAGVLGTMIYLILLELQLWSLFEKSGIHMDALAIGMAGLCYAIQALINISMSSVTGIIFVLLFAGQLIINKTKREEQT